MVTGGEIGLGVRIAGFLRSVWKKTPFGRLADFERRIAALEGILAKAPAEACKFCGERTRRLKEAGRPLGEGGKQYRYMLWRCEACAKEEQTIEQFR